MTIPTDGPLIKLEGDTTALVQGMAETKAQLLSRQQATKENRKALQRYRENLFLAEGLGVYFMRAVEAKRTKRRKGQHF